ncbi:MAG: hypothetical protein QGG64_04370 [Candidatus Latescibacteria bacterium]|jgi:hypothetical protein|nr:hypothetical protein [Candidatus Latescibacterota bacterium]
MIAILLRGAFCLAVFWAVCGLAEASDSDISSAKSDSLFKHDPYDISMGGDVDSNDVYVTKVNHLLRLPRYALILNIGIPYGIIGMHFCSGMKVKYSIISTTLHGMISTLHGAGALLFARKWVCLPNSSWDTAQ